MFPNLLWILRLERIPQWLLAETVGISAAALSLKLAGRMSFLEMERARVAQIVGYREQWLFQQLAPPESERITRTVAGREIAALTPATESR